MSDLIFALPMMVKPELEKAMQDLCFGSCGKISASGAIVIEPYGPCWVCCESECPNLLKQTEPIGKSEITGDDVAIRIINQ